MTQTHANRYWRSLDELENTPEFQEFLTREFPVAASEYPDGVSRRRWLQLMGASFALASVSGCRWETEKFAPFLHRPEGYIPGKPVKYATTIEWAGAPRHLMVTSYDGRPIKIEGNPDHPGSLGGTDGYSQAATLTLFDPDRSRTIYKRDGNQTFSRDFSDFDAFLTTRRAELAARQGAGLAILLDPTSSLAVGSVLARLVEEMPQAKVYEYAPLADTSAAEGRRIAFGQGVRAHYDLKQTKVLACFDADLLCMAHPNGTRLARDWADARDAGVADPANATLCRMYAIESQFSLTGSSADHRFPLQSQAIGVFLRDLRDQINARIAGQVPAAPTTQGESHTLVDKAARIPTREEMLFCLAEDLVANQGAGVVVVGPTQPAAVHALANQINSILGNIGKTITYTSLPNLGPERGPLGDLVRQVGIDGVDTLVMVGGNPVYDAPADFEFAKLLEKIPHTVHVGYYRDETALVADWHAPLCHPLECWGDALSYDGLVSISQPLIEPLVESFSPLQVLAKLAGVTATPQLIVRQAISQTMASPLSTDQWKKLIHDGFGGESLLEPVTPTLADNLPDVAEPEAESIEIVFTPSSSTYDGRFANNGWLQESPDHLTKVTWDNVARVSPKTAKQLNVGQKKNTDLCDVLRIQVGSATVEVPVYVLPGQADNSIGIELGYGRTTAGMVGGYMQTDDPIDPVGVNVYPIRTSTAPHVAVGAKCTPAGRTYKIAVTQDHFAIDMVGLQMTDNRIGQLIREASLDFYKHTPDFAQKVVHEVESPALFVEKEYANGNKWGLSIDLNKCLGCNACMLACQAENNVPVVGKDQVSRGREMHWIRIDRYFAGPVDNPTVASQPLTCMQCETAPCEQVCPVAATMHSNEGLNDMVYNRCIGTRYCANNCPYKVRRFNYFHFTGYMEKESNSLMQLALNPEVTVRSRGVMEKCTYCVQRIAAARIPARAEGRPIADGEIQVACQQACPTRAIDFGDLNDKNSVISKKHHDQRAYGILTELKTKPRTLYLAKVRNPHPLLSFVYPEPPQQGAHHHGDEHEDDHKATDPHSAPQHEHN